MKTRKRKAGRRVDALNGIRVILIIKLIGDDVGRIAFAHQNDTSSAQYVVNSTILDAISLDNDRANATAEQTKSHFVLLSLFRCLSGRRFVLPPNRIK